MEERLIYIDGEFYPKSQAKVSVFDHGYLYGDGVFEGIRAYNGRIFRCEEHIDRLFRCAKAILLDIPLTKEEITEAMLETVRRNNLKDAYIRLVVSRGVGDLALSPNRCPKATVVIIADQVKLFTPEMHERGLKVITSSVRRNSPASLDPQIKSLNYLNNILARIEADRYGADEALMLNHEGIVAECTGDNVFIVIDGKIYTPSIYVGTLNGITRKMAIEACKRLEIEVIEREFTLFDLYNADECFFTGTAAEVIAVTEVDGRIIGPGKQGPTTAKVLEEFRKATQTEGREIYI